MSALATAAQAQISAFQVSLNAKGGASDALLAEQKTLLSTLGDLRVEAEYLLGIYKISSERASLQAAIIKAMALEAAPVAPDAAFTNARNAFLSQTINPGGLIPLVKANLTKNAKSNAATTIGNFTAAANTLNATIQALDFSGKTIAQITALLQAAAISSPPATLSPLASMINQANLATNNNGGAFGFSGTRYAAFRTQFASWETKINQAIAALNALTAAPAPIVGKINQAANLHVFLQTPAEGAALRGFAPVNFPNYAALVINCRTVSNSLTAGLSFVPTYIAVFNAAVSKDMQKSALMKEVGAALTTLNDILTQGAAALPVPIMPPNTTRVASVVPLLPNNTDPVFELWVRVYPDEAAINQFSPALSPREEELGKLVWTEIATSKPMDEKAFYDGWTKLFNGLGHFRAMWIFKVLQPTNLAQLANGQTSTPVFPAVQVQQAGTMSHRPHSLVMPDSLVLAAYRGDIEQYRQYGFSIPKPLPCGPDLSNPNSIGLDANGKLTYSQDIRWMFDFKEAVRIGMGFRLKVSAQEAQTGGVGFDRIVVAGVQQTTDGATTLTPAMAKLNMFNYINNLKYSPSGFELLKQGAATNNTSGSDSVFKSKTVAQSFVAISENKPRSLANMPCPDDGTILAQALGVAPAVFEGVDGVNNADMMDAKAMNAALWPATMGNFLREAFSSHVLGEMSMVSPKDIAETRRFFTEHVKGRGNLPAVRIGKQPYGIMTVMNFKRSSTQIDHKTDYYVRLYDLLINRLWNTFSQKIWGHQTQPLQDVTMGGKWKSIANQLKNIDAPVANSDEYQARFMQMLGLLPRSREFFIRYGMAVRGDYMLGGLLGLVSGDSGATADNPIPSQLKADLQKLFESFYDKTIYKELYRKKQSYGVIQDVPGSIEHRYTVNQTLLGRSVFTEKQAKANYAVTKDKLSESDSLPQGQNYIQWLIDNLHTQLSPTNRKSFLETSTNQDKSLLYLLLKQALVLAYWDEAVSVVAKNFHPDKLTTTVVGLYETTNTTPFFRTRQFAANDQTGLKAFLSGELRKAQAANITLKDCTIFNDQLTAFTIELNSKVQARVHRAVNIWNIYHTINWYAVHRILLGRIDNVQAANTYTAAELALLDRTAVDWVVGYANASTYYQFLRPDSNAYTYQPLQASATNSWKGNVPEYFDQSFLTNTKRANRMFYLLGLNAGAVNGNTDARNMFELIRANVTSNPAAVSNELKEVLKSLTYLVGVPTARLDRALSEHLDLCSHRLDAWVLGLANKKMADIRKSDPNAATYFGAYSFVENLRPGKQLKDVNGANINYHFNADGSSPLVIDPDIQGYVHAPTMLQAIASAVLRSGYLANEGKQMQVNLSSLRVRKAMSMIQGVQQGKSLGEMLGYELERAIEDTNQALLAYLPNLREAFPLSTTNNGQSPKGELNLTDGVQLLAFLQTPNADLSTKLTTLTATHKTQLLQAIDKIQDAVDAVGDLLLSEGVLQYVQGNYDRAGASMKALSRGERPPQEYEVVKTPRTGFMYPQRVMLCENVQSPPERITPRANLEPNLNGWLRQLFPRWDELSVAYTIMKDKDNDIKELSISQTGINPIDLYYALLRPIEDKDGYLNQWLIDAVRQSEGYNIPLELEIKIHYRQPISSGASLLTYLPICRQVAKLLKSGRPLHAGDFTLGSDANASKTNQHWKELIERLEIQEAELSAISKSLKDLDGQNPNDQDTETLRTLLRKLWLFGDANALAGNVLSRDNEAMCTRIHSLAGVIAQKYATVQELGAKINAVRTWDEENTQILFDQANAFFGEQFVVFPLFTPHNSSDLEESYTSLQIADSKPLPMERWINGATKVRTALAPIENIMSLKGIRNFGKFSIKPMQLPLIGKDHWVGMELPQGYRLTGQKLSMACFSSNPLSFQQHCWGWFVDEWTEVIPDTHLTTGLAVHYDQPNAQAPQAMLLAVHSGSTTDVWTDDELLGVVNSTFDLAKLRAVEPDHFGTSPEGYQIALPAIMGKIKFGVDKQQDLRTVVNTRMGAAFYNTIDWGFDEDASDIFTDFGDNFKP